MPYRRIGNFFVIGLIDRVDGEKVYRVQCVCGMTGKIGELSLRSRVSCGCTKLVRPHRLGLKVNCYTFSRLVGESGGKHMYEIDCSRCGGSSVVPHSYSRDKCPECPRTMVVEGVKVDLTSEAKRIGIHVNALRQRLQRMSLEEALSMPRRDVGGCRGRHGKVFFRGVTDTVPGHLRRIGAANKKGAVYYWIRSGMEPQEALSRCLDTPEGLETLRRLFPAPCQS